jgi:hypothetical protein
MADNTTLPGTGEVVASKDIGGIKYQRMINTRPQDGSDIEVGSEDSLQLLRSILEALQASSTMDSKDRQRIIIDGIGAGAVTELTTGVPVTGGTPVIAAGANFIGYVGIAGTAAAGFIQVVDQREELIQRGDIAFAETMMPNLSW